MSDYITVIYSTVKLIFTQHYS